MQLTNYSWNIFFFRKKNLSFAGAHSQKNTNITIIDQEKHKIKKIYIWNLITTELIM